MDALDIMLAALKPHLREGDWASANAWASNSGTRTYSLGVISEDVPCEHASRFAAHVSSAPSPEAAVAKAIAQLADRSCCKCSGCANDRATEAAGEEASAER
jgi:hypothetical protein